MAWPVEIVVLKNKSLCWFFLLIGVFFSGDFSILCTGLRQSGGKSSIPATLVFLPNTTTPWLKFLRVVLMLSACLTSSGLSLCLTMCVRLNFSMLPNSLSIWDNVSF